MRFTVLRSKAVSRQTCEKKHQPPLANYMQMLWFNFILGLSFIFFCFKLIIIHYHTQKQKKIKFKPRIKLNHNTHVNGKFKIQSFGRQQTVFSRLFALKTWFELSRVKLYRNDLRGNKNYFDLAGGSSYRESSTVFRLY